jgi:hypothetical protein
MYLVPDGSNVQTSSVVVHERPTNALISFKVYSLSYLLLHVSASSIPSSGSLHVPTESLLIKFYTMDGGTMGTGFFPGVKRPGRGADHPPPSSAEVENE